MAAIGDIGVVVFHISICGMTYHENKLQVYCMLVLVPVLGSIYQCQEVVAV